MDAGAIIGLASLAMQLLIVVFGIVYGLGGDKKRNALLETITNESIKRIETVIGARLDKFETHVSQKLDKLDGRVDEVSKNSNTEMISVRSKIHRMMNVITRLESRVDFLDRQMGNSTPPPALVSEDE